MTSLKRMLMLFLIPLIFNSSIFEYEKSEAIDLYETHYAGTRISRISWNGSVQSCDPGKLSTDLLQRAETRINYFRRSAGLKPITLSEEFNKKAQLTALMMTANDQISHTPGKNWKCFTETGSEGAKNSNLGISDFENFPDMSFITGFILDYGSINNNIGHRKWMLNSKAELMGYGATGKHEAIYVTGLNTTTVPETPEFIAYPPAGYFPHHLIFEKWSFALPADKKVDFRKAKVEMTDGQGRKMNVRILSTEDPWYFDPTIVWQAEDLFTQDEIKYVKNSLAERGYLDKPITVRITGVQGDSEKKDFTYRVVPFDPVK
ncbi:MAG: CAP domain-containing protein [Cyclobacteriaceae bacterium]|nr:CAP domain-containing protein [Cyclobacteriaceae bacterium]